MPVGAVEYGEATSQILDAMYPLTGNEARLLAMAMVAGNVDTLPVHEPLRLEISELADRAPSGGAAVVSDIAGRAQSRVALIDALAFEGRRATTDWASLPGINEALVAAARVTDGDRMFDPCFGTAGSLLAANSRATGVSFAGFELNSEAHAGGSLRVAAHDSDASKLRLGDFASANLAELGLEASCDVVISDLPFGMPFRPDAHGIDWPDGFPVRTFEWFAMHKAISVLRDGGRFAFVVPRTILGNERDAAVRRWFYERANVTHVIALPSGVLGRTASPAAIIAGDVGPIRQDYVELVAVPRTGSATTAHQLSVADALSRADEYMSRAADTEVYEVPGEWCVRPIGEMLEDPENPIDIVTELAWLEQGTLSADIAAAFPEGVVRLGDVGEVCRGNSAHARRELAERLAADPSHRCVEITAKGEVRPWDLEAADEGSALLITVPTERFASGFLEWFLSSRYGTTQRAILASGIARPQLTPRHALEIRLPATPLEKQIEMVACARSLDLHAIQLDQWRTQLDAQPYSAMPLIRERLSPGRDTTGTVLANLPFPLAMAYRRADVEQNLHTQHKSLVQVLEATSQFVAIVSWSIVYRDEELQEQHQESWSRGKRSRTPSLVTWIELGQSLAKILRRVRAENPQRWNAISGTDDPALADLLASKRMFKIFDDARLHRNSWDGHIGHVPDVTLRELIQDLRGFLEKLFALFGDVWTRHQLVRARDGWREDEHDVQNFDVLTGAVQPFEALNDVRINELIRRDRLCLLSPGSRNPVELIPLIRMDAPPRTDKGAAYFFSRVDENGPRFITYQPDGEAEWRPEQTSADLTRALDWLSPPGA